MNKMILTLTILLAATATLSACKTTVQDGPRKVIVEDGHHSEGTFCPPGHAKKGEC